MKKLPLFSKDKMKCHDCIYWDKEEERGKAGFCRKNAPTTSNEYEGETHRDIAWAIWPITDGKEDWCGEGRKEGVE